MKKRFLYFIDPDDLEYYTQHRTELGPAMADENLPVLLPSQANWTHNFFIEPWGKQIFLAYQDEHQALADMFIGRADECGVIVNLIHIPCGLKYAHKQMVKLKGERS